MATAIEYGLIAALCFTAGATADQYLIKGQEAPPCVSASVPKPVVAPPEKSTVNLLKNDYADRGGPPWYDKPEKVTDLKAALVDDKRFLGSDNVGFSMMANDFVCSRLKTVRIACDYNSRSTLSLFLTVNGKGLFPSAGGTNPYFSKYDPSMGPDDGFIGQPAQNRMLADAVRRNALLFHNGNLTAKDVRKHWQ